MTLRISVSLCPFGLAGSPGDVTPGFLWHHQDRQSPELEAVICRVQKVRGESFFHLWTGGGLFCLLLKWFTNRGELYIKLKQILPKACQLLDEFRVTVKKGAIYKLLNELFLATSRLGSMSL